jgi:transcriptional regulator with PAS, ATPase and Fis domain
VLLDEIGELPPSLQVKLLRVLQEGEVTRVGATEPRKVDVRVISATNSDLNAAVQAGRFRDDLYFRIAAFPLTLPPLRDRPDDLPLLVDFFVARAGKRHGKRLAGITPDAFEVLALHRWPGNVRELENEIERAAALTADGALVSLQALSPRIRRTVAASPALSDGATGPRWQSPFVAAQVPDGHSGSPSPLSETARSLKDARATFEADYIRAQLERNGGNVSRTARALGVSRVTLQKKLRELGLR